MADILIRGMEMPLRCLNCPFKTYYHGENRCLANRGKPIEYVIGNDRGTNCPLVTLPEGHGRLGDLDALMNNIGDVPYKGSVRRVLMSAPTIVPAEGGTNGEHV